MSHQMYNFRLVDQSTNNRDEVDGLICVEEMLPPTHTALPEFISQRQVYTEKDCRAVARDLAKCIRSLHEAGIAHRNLHLENVIVSPWVSLILFSN